MKARISSSIAKFLAASIISMVAAIMLPACAVKTKVMPAETAYTAESTYQKLRASYPFIQIASQTLPASVRLLPDLPYVRHGDKDLQLDLYLPAQAKGAGFRVNPDRPAIVLVHGGGWRSGSRDNLGAMAIRLAERGYVCAAISYRLSTEARYPAAIHDVKAAVRWMRSHASSYYINPHQIAVAGGSAGGQIAALVGVTNDMASFDMQAGGSIVSSVVSSTVSSAVQAVINIDGLSDFTSEEARRYEDDPSKKTTAAGAWLGGSYAEKTAVWKEASPLTHVSKDTPPFLFISSAQKRFSLGREEMMEKMKAMGIVTKHVQLPDTPHSFWLFDPWLEPTVDAVSVFLEEIFSVKR
ncbi:alpha/beta hydrolase [Undibacterium pigrum]|uniref:Acetyl esterase/lipase n=1 Tax=Undibacterium pigrum TaxID=401470 RepID=A0A318J4H0_9BURK|nr:alpha/beta hydrolase [Undibacterium pigrum]PXX42668.1 acetyl esterase/lipase [Undibacterium pigrum]